ncbi:hypothetical protein B0H13DRAFT_1890776 [Mycena leptocephala]|nr:hypothetical protein B0H13DRAFT_1890776 [Mycena leptocephala]
MQHRVAEQESLIPIARNIIALSSFHDVEVPSTVHDAEQLLHLVQAHRNTCELKKTVAVQRLHTALLYVQGLRKEVETADHTLSAANEDLGRVRTAIRETGLPGTQIQIDYFTWKEFLVDPVASCVFRN